MTHYCPKCGQRVLLRYGVHLSPRRADIFDVIKRASKYGGVSSLNLEGMFGKNVVKVHVSDINKLLTNVGYAIICSRTGCARGFYRLVKIRRKSNAKFDPTSTIPVRTSIKIPEQIHP